VLLLLNSHYYPDVASTGQHLTDLAEHLASRGVAVEVLTSRGHYVAGSIDAPAREVQRGVRIRRVRTTAFGRSSRIGRIVDYATYYARALWVVCTDPSVTAVLCLTTPPLLPVVGRVGRLLRGRPYGIWSMDLHPEAEIAAGMVEARSLVGRLLTALDDAAYRGADFVVALGDYMRTRIVAKGVSPARVAVVPVWGHAPATSGADGAAAWRSALGLDGQFVVMYSGNAGLVHDFTDILEAMRLLRADPRVSFLFVGGGPQRSAIEAYAAAHGLTRFAYRPYVPREQVGDLLAVADVHLVSLRPAFVGISVPGKLYGIMAAARPALFVGPAHCETADAIRDADCGVAIDPAAGDGARRIVAAIEAWVADPAAARAAGLRGLAAFRARFGAERNCEAVADVIRRSWPRSWMARPAAAIPRPPSESVV